METKLDLAAILEDIFLVLNPKEKEVIIKRFSLNNEPRQTLEKIGQEFSVTRERVRQIEKIALGKLRRTLENTKLAEVTRYAKQLLAEHGDACREDQLVSEILQKLYTDSPVDSHIVRLALAICPEIEYCEKHGRTVPYWKLTNLTDQKIETILDVAYDILSKKKDSEVLAEMVEETKERLADRNVSVTPQTIASLLAVDLRFKIVKDSVGLMSWRHINPKSIRDKAYIILKRETKPMHFVEIANKITESHFDKKSVTTQAVHNELIRDEHFVLVGRGLYALKEWGYKRGTVAEVIEDLLRKKSPLTKQEIIAGVMKQRHVKKGTISLNLQKNSQFVRVGRAVYSLKEGK